VTGGRVFASIDETRLNEHCRIQGDLFERVPFVVVLFRTTHTILIDSSGLAYDACAGGVPGLNEKLDRVGPRFPSIVMILEMAMEQTPTHRFQRAEDVSVKRVGFVSPSKWNKMKLDTEPARDDLCRCGSMDGTTIQMLDRRRPALMLSGRLKQLCTLFRRS
jgi:hypothetical protein